MGAKELTQILEPLTIALLAINNLLYSRIVRKLEDRIDELEQQYGKNEVRSESNHRT